MNHLKKTLLCLLATTFCSTSQFALAEKKGNFYITGGGGIALGNQISTPFETQQTKISIDENGVEIDRETTDVTGALSSKGGATGGQILAGIGYHLTEDLRIEGVFVKPIISYTKFKTRIAGMPKSEKNLDNGLKVTPEINSLQLRAYYDVLKLSEEASLYAGAGLGASQIKIKTSDSYWEIGKTKAKNNFAWFVGAGINFAVKEGVKLGVEYNYSDFGKSIKMDGTDNALSFKTNSVLAKISFDI